MSETFQVGLDMGGIGFEVAEPIVEKRMEDIEVDVDFVGAADHLSGTESRPPRMASERIGTAGPAAPAWHTRLRRDWNPALLGRKSRLMFL